MASLKPKALLTALLLAAGCDNERVPDTTTPPPPPPSLASMALTLSAEAAAVGQRITASVVGRYSDGTERDVSADVSWRSSDPATLEVLADPPATFRAKARGEADLIATFGEVRALAHVVVSDARVSALELVPPSGLIGIGGTLKVRAVATYTDETRATVTATAEWASDTPGVLLPSAQDKGYLVTFAQGQATITARFDGQVATGQFTVTPPRIDYLLLSPQNARIDAVTPVQYGARGHWTDGRLEDVTRQVQWSSSNPAVATIDANGLASATGDGSVVITATLDDVSAMTTARTVTSNCPYPDNPALDIQYDGVMPSYFWLDAYDNAGGTDDFNLADVYCNSTQVKTLIFVVSAGWCPYCPDYMKMVDDLSPMLEAEGAKVVYVVIETASGAPANNMQANSMVSRETMNIGHSVRVGDGVTAGGASSPFSRAVSALPSAFVVRTRDMRVIASQERSGSILDFLSIARNPERLW